MKPLSCAALIMVSALIAAPAVADLPEYQMKDLGTLGGSESTAAAINNAGQVAGTATTAAGVVHAFIADGDGPMHDLGDMDRGGVHVTDINEVGQITGWAGQRAFIASVEQPMQSLGTLGGEASEGYALNDAGQVVGAARIAGGLVKHAFIAGLNQPMEDLGTLGGDWSEAYSINNAGQVTGVAHRADGTGHAFIASTSQPMRDLDTLGANSGGAKINEAGLVTGYVHIAGAMHVFTASATQPMQAFDLGFASGNDTEPYDVNEGGQIVGGAENPEGHFRAFTVSATQPMLDLGTLGGEGGSANAINKAGQITGEADLPFDAHSTHAFVVTAGHPMIDLGTLGGSSSRALGINDQGQVAGHSYTADGDRHAFLATPISLLFTRLLDSVDGVGPGTVLSDQVQRAFDYYQADHGPNTCSALSLFIALVDSQRGQEITAGQAATLIADAREIQSAIGCGSWQIDADLKPLSSRNGVNLKSNDSVRVAIFGNSTFDALQIDPASARLGPKAAQPKRHEVKDYNGDGSMDLGLIFRIRDVGFACGDQQVTLTATTYAGETVAGTDAVHAWNCRK
jgi:probable HAF family extracellular repeat protein